MKESERPADAAPASLTDAWEANAADWVAWARKPGHDSYWQFHRDIFRTLLPPPRGRSLDVGCGEGRLPRDLKSWGYDVAGVDISATLVAAAREADPDGEYVVADAAALPYADATFALVTAFMSLHDVDRFEEAFAEIGRVLAPGGRVCMAIVHPIASAGEFATSEPDSPFVITGPYLEERRVGGKPYVRGGLSMRFYSKHRPLQAYFDELARAGLKVEQLLEVPGNSPTDPPRSRWERIPNFLDLRAQKI